MKYNSRRQEKSQTWNANTPQSYPKVEERTLWTESDMQTFVFTANNQAVKKHTSMEKQICQGWEKETRIYHMRQKRNF